MEERNENDLDEELVETPSPEADAPLDNYAENAESNEPTEPWSSGLWDCQAAMSEALCEVLLCHPCNVSRQIEALRDPPRGGEKELNPMPCLSVIIMDVMLLCAGSMFAGFFVRRAVREKFNIYEAECAEFGSGCFCFCCSLCQTQRELRLRGHPPLSAWPSQPVRTTPARRRSQTRSRPRPRAPIR